MRLAILVVALASAACGSASSSTDSGVDSGTGGGSAGGGTGGGAGGGGGTTTNDAGRPDGGSVDAGALSDAGVSVCQVAGLDAGVPGGELDSQGAPTFAGTAISPDGGLTATASASYSGYGPENVIDGQVGVSWYLPSGACPEFQGLYCCGAHAVVVQLPTAQTISGVVVRGNRDFASAYDVFTGRIELLGASSAVLSTKTVVFRLPDADWAGSFSPAVSGVVSIRFTPALAEAGGPGIGEITAYRP